MSRRQAYCAAERKSSAVLPKIGGIDSWVPDCAASHRTKMAR
jgi:hypothetical protein